MINPEPTRRAVIDVGRPCNIRCSFCYYRYEKPTPFVPFETLKQQIIEAKGRGNNTIDFTGGEPTMHPQIVELVKVCSDNQMKSCIITNAILLSKDNLINKLLEAGLSDLLITIQGLPEAHNKSICAKTYEKVIRAIDFMHENKLFYRTNTILTMDTFKGLPELAKLLAEKKPKISNFINFNARYNWTKVDRERIQARCSDIASYLKEAISILEASDIGVNVRYFPICLLKGFEKNVCNGSLVIFDPYEWDYGFVPKTFEVYKKAGQNICQAINSNGLCPECMSCEIKTICGTVDKPYFQRFGAAELEPYKEKMDDLYFFRRNNKPITLIQGY